MLLYRIAVNTAKSIAAFSKNIENAKMNVFLFMFSSVFFSYS